MATAASSMGGAPGKSRTCDLGFRKALLYPTELRGRTARRLPRVRHPLKGSLDPPALG